MYRSTRHTAITFRCANLWAPRSTPRLPPSRPQSPLGSILDAEINLLEPIPIMPLHSSGLTTTTAPRQLLATQNAQVSGLIQVLAERDRQKAVGLALASFVTNQIDPEDFYSLPEPHQYPPARPKPASRSNSWDNAAFFSPECISTAPHRLTTSGKLRATTTAPPRLLRLPRLPQRKYHFWIGEVYYSQPHGHYNYNVLPRTRVPRQSYSKALYYCPRRYHHYTLHLPRSRWYKRSSACYLCKSQSAIPALPAPEAIPDKESKKIACLIGDFTRMAIPAFKPPCTTPNVLWNTAECREWMRWFLATEFRCLPVNSGYLSKSLVDEGVTGLDLYLRRRREWIKKLKGDYQGKFMHGMLKWARLDKEARVETGLLSSRILRPGSVDWIRVDC